MFYKMNEVLYSVGMCAVRGGIDDAAHLNGTNLLHN